jgi:flagellar basal body-associated protein FliL
VPESKKRKKNSSYRKPSAPPVAKAELAKKKKPMSRQQIGIIVISVLVILSMAVGFLFSGSSTSQPVPQTSSTGQEILVSTPAPDSAAPTDATSK